MVSQKKIICRRNKLLIIITIIYDFLLHNYNYKLYKIQNRYENKIVAAIKVFEDQHFLFYLFGGAVLVIFLIWASINRIKDVEIIGLKCTIIFCLINLCLLVVLVIIYSNPVFTTFVIVCGLGMFFMNM